MIDVLNTLNETEMLAEQSVVGAIIIDEACMSVVTSTISVGGFLMEKNRAIDQAALERKDEGTPIDPVTILAKCGETVSADYLKTLMENTLTAANAAEYAAQVRRASIRRAVQKVASSMMERASGVEDPRSIIGDSAKMLEHIEALDTSREVATSEEMMHELLKHRKLVDGGRGGYVRTKLKPLDDILGGGLLASGFYILAARPAMGKTTFALSVADSMAESGPVLFVSLEMSLSQIAAKRVARVAGISSTVMLMGNPTDDERKKANEAVLALKKSSLVVNRRSRATVTDIAAMARKVSDLRCIVIDYFGLIQPETNRTSRYESCTEISWSLKSLARQLDIPILCLAQLNRENMGRKGNRPQLSDLRDTGALEQDADGVMFLHRDDYYNDDGAPLNPWDPVQLEIIVAKNRHGRTGNCGAAFYMGPGRIVPARR
jgi:replicative DNA helicase